MILDVKNLNKRFDGLKVLSNCSFSVEEGEIVGLIGPNGAGKTTLFNVIAGFIPLDSGQILFKGNDIAGIKPYIIARKGIARTNQITRVFPKMTLLENLILPVRGANSPKRAIELLELAGLANLKDEELIYLHENLGKYIRPLVSGLI